MTNQHQITFGDVWGGAPVLSPGTKLRPDFSTPLGVLFQGDCIDILPHLRNEAFDTIFADPPFNLGKDYGAKVEDERPNAEYVRWSKAWIDECIRVLKPGGAFFLYNIPKWNTLLGAHVMERGLEFRHWVAVSIKLGLPIQRRLYPAHYSLLYFTKGRPKTFRNIRTPIEVCRHCGKEIKDYGGHRGAMNPRGVNLTDVWTDIPAVRHRKFKSELRKANQLSTKLLRRVVELSTHPGEIVLDPFGGSGTTFDVCERLHRYWVGIEMGSIEAIIERMATSNLEHHATDDFVEHVSSP